MAYKPKAASIFDGPTDGRDKYPLGSATGKGGGVVPGTTGSQDRGSQPKGAEFSDVTSYGTEANMVGQDFALGDGGMNNRLDPRQNPNFGKRSYSAEQPTL